MLSDLVSFRPVTCRICVEFQIADLGLSTWVGISQTLLQQIIFQVAFSGRSFITRCLRLCFQFTCDLLCVSLRLCFVLTYLDLAENLIRQNPAFSDHRCPNEALFKHQSILFQIPALAHLPRRGIHHHDVSGLPALG